ncbi:hypothetical protein P9139_11240 [Curtobacterium flaccumfaciens]|nr:hypothetical protein P9139_11240 [Curtobacterium flaccumfaciens]
MKLSLATALAHDPELLVLDEPSSGLDPVSRRELADTVREFVLDPGTPCCSRRTSRRNSTTWRTTSSS